MSISIGPRGPQAAGAGQTTEKRRRTKVDPQLKVELRQAGNRPLEAGFTLWPLGSGKVRGKEQTLRQANAILKAAERVSGEKVDKLNVFGNLERFVVVASPRFVRAVIASGNAWHAWSVFFRGGGPG